MKTKIASGHFLLLSAAVIWGFAFVAQSKGMDFMQPLTFNGIRFLIGAVSLIPLAFLFKPTITRKTPLRKGLLMGLLAGFPLFFASSFQQLGILYTSAGNAGFITSLYIIFVPVFALASKKRAETQTWIGISLATVGLYFISAYPGFTMQTGDLLVLISAVFWALHLIVLSYLSPGYDFRLLAISQYFFVGLLSLGIGLLWKETFNWDSIQAAMWPLLYAGIASVGIGYTLQLTGQRTVRADHAALLLSLEAVFAAFGGWLLLSENISTVGIFGSILMLAGVIVAQVSFSSKQKTPKA
ncbi:MAG: DMT family transporter [Bacteroidales bacterium]|nr:DMT family transporter [Bacteroidales bacterium]